MRIGVLIGAGAGDGKAASRAGRLFEALRGHEVFSVRGWGGEGVGGAVLSPKGAQGYLPALHAAVDALLEKAPDLYVLLGGDGLSAYAADRLTQRGAVRPALLGVAGGTANVGPIVALTVDEVDGGVLDARLYGPVDALEASDAEGHLALGFNDLVVGNTLLGTVEGRMETLDARALAEEGRKVQKVPLDHIAEGLIVRKNGRAARGGPAAPAQIVLSCLDQDRTYGRAVMGALCLAAGVSHTAGLTLLESPIITAQDTAAGHDDFLQTAQMLFGERDEIALENLSSDACLIADGNPYRIRGNRLFVRLRKDIVRVFKRRREG